MLHGMQDPLMREATSRTPFDLTNGTTGRKMMTKKKLILAVLTGPFSLAACTQATPRSSDYFAEHLEEARQVVAGCRDGTVPRRRASRAENGRASGRERVCQYVSFSVFSVFLNKKTNIYITKITTADDTS